MRSAPAMFMIAFAACSAERRPSSDTTAVDSAVAPSAPMDSQGAAASDARQPANTKAPVRGAVDTKSSKTAIDADTALHPTDTFAIHPRDSTIADFLKKRPPEVRRPQDPQKTPR